MSPQEKDQAQQEAESDFEQIDAIQNKIISCYESLGEHIVTKDAVDAAFAKREEDIRGLISSLEAQLDKLNADR